MRRLLGFTICISLVLFLLLGYGKATCESFTSVQPLRAYTAEYDTPYDRQVLLNYKITPQGKFIEKTEDNVDAVQPYNALLPSLPKRPQPIIPRPLRPLRWHCQRPWEVCSGPSYLKEYEACLPEVSLKRYIFPP